VKYSTAAMIFAFGSPFEDKTVVEVGCGVTEEGVTGREKGRELMERSFLCKTTSFHVSSQDDASNRRSKYRLRVSHASIESCTVRCRSWKILGMGYRWLR